MQLQQSWDAFGIFSGITGNVGDDHFYFFDGKNNCFREHRAKDMTVNIAIHCSQGFEIGKGIAGFGVADIACMPYFIAGFKKIKHPRMNEPVGV